MCQQSSIFAKNRKVENWPQLGRRPDGNYANYDIFKTLVRKNESYSIVHLYQVCCTILKVSLAIFYLHLGFLSISYTRAKKVMFHALMSPRILNHISEGYSIKDIYI